MSDRVLVVFEADDSPHNMYFLAPEGLGSTAAFTVATTVVQAYDETFDFNSMEEHQPQNALELSGFEMVQVVVLEEKW
jgi:hypothetical protein